MLPLQYCSAFHAGNSFRKINLSNAAPFHSSIEEVYGAAISRCSYLDEYEANENRDGDIRLVRQADDDGKLIAIHSSFVPKINKAEYRAEYLVVVDRAMLIDASDHPPPPPHLLPPPPPKLPLCLIANLLTSSLAARWTGTLQKEKRRKLALRRRSDFSRSSAIGR